MAEIALHPEGQEEYILDTPLLRNFIEEVRRTIAEQTDVSEALDALQPSFTTLLADQSWLPDQFAAPYAASGMGGGIASWLLFRASDHSFSLISLVVPPGSETPVHDHLAWGFVGLYRGEQREMVYMRHVDADSGGTKAYGPSGVEARHHDNDSADVEHVKLSIAQVNDLKPGDLYRLLPPDGDIHSVKTTSVEPSISIHLLTNDIGCVVRHAYDPEASTARPFRSGYSNMACEDE